MPGDSFSDLIIRCFGWLFMAVICAWFLFRADQETMRLFNLKKLYGLTKHDDETEIKKTKKGVVFIYTLLLTISLAAALYVGIQIWTRF